MSANTWTDNTASYGERWATDLNELYSPPSAIVPKYSSVFPQLNVTARDYYGQLITTYNAKVTAVIFSDRDCFNLTGYILGSTTTALSSGVSAVTDLEGACYPGGKLAVQFSVSSTKLFANKTTYSFPRCGRGDYYASQKCVKCESGKYSLVDNYNNTITSCTSCSSEVVTCFGDVIVLAPGQWRNSLWAETWFNCPYGSLACIGGNTTGNTSCNQGHYGPLCAVCEAGYYYSSSVRGCTSCTQNAGAAITVWVTVFVGILLSFVLYFYWAQRHDIAVRRTNLMAQAVKRSIHLSGDGATLTAFVESTESSQRKEDARLVELYKRRLQIRDTYTNMQAKFKILLSVMQVT